jgi:hypothetical protein
MTVSAVYLADYSIFGGHDQAFGQGVRWDPDLLSGYDTEFLAGVDRRAN